MFTDTEVPSIPSAAADSPVTPVHPDVLTARSHGFLRIMKRPAQWLIIISLLISWSVAGVVMFDFVTDDQLASKSQFILFTYDKLCFFELFGSRQTFLVQTSRNLDLILC